MKILSTKKLKPDQRDLLLGAGFSVVDYDAIAIEFLDFKLPSEIDNAIFTSQNGVSALITSSEFALSQLKTAGVQVFCVGYKTKALLEQNGLKVVKMVENSAKLGDFIVKNYKNETFHYFCGSERRHELPEKLKASEIDLFEVKTYKTTLKSKKFNQKWAGILFFSPSGVASFVYENKINDSIAFCIGNTTGKEAKKYTPNTVIAISASVESVLAKAAKTLKKL
jgi:uroporphyrinogen-III synthase